MGIAYSTGIIRDFAGPYYVSENEMAFGSKYKKFQFVENSLEYDVNYFYKNPQDTCN